MIRREATHAGSWYTDDPAKLGKLIDAWIAATPEEKRRKARVIVAPHAGYRFCGATAGHSYGALNVGEGSPVNTVFVLGPSHYVPLSGCSISRFKSLETPFGDIPVNKKVVDELLSLKLFAQLDTDTDLEEHSLEMQLPFIHRAFGGKPFTVVPILVGSCGMDKIRKFGSAFAKYIKDPTCAFVISSDFCHWGRRFRYTYVNKEWMSAKGATISDSIRALDLLAAEKIAAGDTDAYAAYTDTYKNTICGRIAILTVLAAMEASGLPCKGDIAHYSQSSSVASMDDSSVSYCGITFAIYN